jgi:uncharacterized membrane protein HdeD (DUF308 family)
MTHQGTHDAPSAAGWEQRAATTDPLRRARTWLIVTGVLALIVGAVAIAVPAAASVTIALFIGWLLVFIGVIATIEAFAEPAPRVLDARRINALLTLAIGLYLVILPESGTLTLTVLLAAWFLASGVLLLLVSRQIVDRTGTTMALVNGIISLLLGVLITADLPSSADWAIGLLVGINLIFWGVRALVAASLLGRLDRSAP